MTRRPRSSVLSSALEGARPLGYGVALAAALLVVAPIAACDRGAADSKQAARGPRPFPVVLDTVSAKEVTYEVHAVGSVRAFEEVQVTSRVTGVVEKVRFTEGQQVKAGQPLVDIEPARFQIAVNSASANLARANAMLAEAQAGLDRRAATTETNPGLIPGEEIATWQTRVSTAEAEVAAARAALARAKLDRRDAQVRAPVSGVLESRTVNTGQYVQPGAILATLVRRDPLQLVFDVPQEQSHGLAKGIPVSFTSGEGQESYRATIKLVTTAADAVTRMVRVNADIDDPRQATLRPGTFAQVTIALGSPREAVVVPQMAVRSSEKGFLAYVVEGDVARERVVRLGMRTADGQVEILEGLREGEALVVRGAEALRDGVPVVSTAPTGQAGSPPSAAAPGASPGDSAGDSPGDSSAAPKDSAAAGSDDGTRAGKAIGDQAGTTGGEAAPK